MEKPLSPHLQIYKPQLTSVLSILHRLTGIILWITAFFFLLWFSLLPNESGYTIFMTCLKSAFGKLSFLSFLFCLYYHYFNGIRHLFWDYGVGFSLKDIYKSGISVIIISLLGALTTFFLWIN